MIAHGGAWVQGGPGYLRICPAGHVERWLGEVNPAANYMCGSKTQVHQVHDEVTSSTCCRTSVALSRFEGAEAAYLLGGASAVLAMLPDDAFDTPHPVYIRGFVR